MDIPAHRAAAVTPTSAHIFDQKEGYQPASPEFGVGPTAAGLVAKARRASGDSPALPALPEPALPEGI
jgi:hypothetical protein